MRGRTPSAPSGRYRYEFHPAYCSEWGGSTGLIQHFFTEFGRLGIEPREIWHGKDDHVLLDVLGWLEDRGNEQNLYLWHHLNFEHLIEKTNANRGDPVKPRIEIHAYVTARQNLSVRWFPADWATTNLNGTVNLDWDYRSAGWCPSPLKSTGEPSDFLKFHAMDEGSFTRRPYNEIMFIHGVGNLDPNPEVEYHRLYNRALVDGMLVALTNGVYTHMIERLKQNFDVRVRTVFKLTMNGDYQVTAWSLEDPEELEAQKDQALYDAIPATHGFTVEQFHEQLELAKLPKVAGAEPPPAYKVGDILTKNLKKMGSSITPSVTERVRALINRVESRLPPTR